MVSASSEGWDWWFKYTYVGVPRELTRTLETSQLLEAGIVAALKANRPDQSQLIDDAAAQVRAHGSKLRFLLKVKELKAFRFEVGLTIGEWNVEPTQVHVLRIDKQTHEPAEAPPIAAIMAEEARQHVAAALGTPPHDYFPIADRPPTSKLTKWMGLVDAT